MSPSAFEFPRDTYPCFAKFFPEKEAAMKRRQKTACRRSKGKRTGSKSMEVDRDQQKEH